VCARWRRCFLTLALIPQGLPHRRAQFRPSDDRLRAHRTSTAICPASPVTPTPCSRAPPTDCGACHGIGTTVRGHGQARQPHPVADRCASCHTPIAGTAVTLTTPRCAANCSTCTTLCRPQGKGPAHRHDWMRCLPYDAHRAGAFFTHKGVTSNCAAVTTCGGDRDAGHPHPGRYVPDPCEAGTRPPTHDLAGNAHQPSGRDGSDCQSCHETAVYLGMTPVQYHSADSRPSATLDANHPKTGVAASAMTRLHSATARCGPRTTFRPVRRARSATRRRATTGLLVTARHRASAGVSAVTVRRWPRLLISPSSTTPGNHFDRQPGLHGSAVTARGT